MGLDFNQQEDVNTSLSLINDMEDGPCVSMVATLGILMFIDFLYAYVYGCFKLPEGTPE